MATGPATFEALTAAELEFPEEPPSEPQLPVVPDYFYGPASSRELKLQAEVTRLRVLVRSLGGTP